MWTFEKKNGIVYVVNPFGDRFQYVVNKKFWVDTDNYEVKVCKT